MAKQMSYKASLLSRKREIKKALILANKKERSVKDIAWLAGIIEGEGCIDFNEDSPRIRVQMSDQDIIKRIANLWNNGDYHTKSVPRYCKPQYSTNVRGKNAIGWMFTIYSFMGVRRRAKIREVLLLSGCLQRTDVQVSTI